MKNSVEKIKILIADSQFLITESLKNILSNYPKYEVIGVVTNVYNLNKIIQSESIHLLITDCILIDFESLSDLKTLINQNPKLKILILTNQLSKIELANLNRFGIKNVIYKTAENDEIFAALEACLKGKKYYSDDILEMLLEVSEKKNSYEETSQLTQSEIDIVKLIADGLTTKAIAERKNISFHTVITHRKNIFRKLCINSSSELIMYAMKAGLIDNLEYYI